MQQLYHMLRTVSRTFALSIEQLPTSLRDAITISYLLLRVSDCLEDHLFMPVERKLELLHLWLQVLKKTKNVDELINCVTDLDNTDPEVLVTQNANLVIEQLYQLEPALEKIITSHVISTSIGMARWQMHGPFVENEAAMDDYMHQVAGSVGYLITEIFAWHIPSIRKRENQLLPLSREYGLALQTVNIIRGMRKDYERGWVYVPCSFYEKFDLTREALFDLTDTARSLKVIDLLTDKAERHLEKGLTYICTLPWYHHRIRLACMWPLLFAVGTLAISRNNTEVLQTEVKLDRSKVRKIVYQTKIWGWSNRWLRQYYRHLARHPEI